jgi:hypothetical protein
VALPNAFATLPHRAADACRGGTSKTATRRSWSGRRRGDLVHELEDVDVANPMGREFLVEVRASGLCHMDLLFATHDFVTTG